MLNRVATCLLTLFFSANLSGSEPNATPPESISTLPGFQIELIRSAATEEGSWISMTFDDHGRIIMADDKAGLIRINLGDAKEGNDREKNHVGVQFERLTNTDHLKHCRGVLYAHQSLYVCETDGQGIHRLQDLDGDGQFETQNLIVPLVYNSRYGHGANQLRLGPDGYIYVSIGNDVFYPENVSSKSPYQKTLNDWMLPNPHDGELDPRSGFILKMNSDGSERIVLNGGLRNQVDIDFNADGELFTWDADMEWDVGLPWYRPTRFNHIVSAGEYGWRWGTGKWANWFPDSLPSNHDTSLGSPTGIAFGTKSNWAGRFREALYAADWQHGRLLMVEFQEQGASYVGQSTVLAEGSPLNISDLEFGPDGSLYFITGGRGSQSGLYRLTTKEPAKSNEALKQLLPDAPKRSADAADARRLRQSIEKLHVQLADTHSMDILWQHLGSKDPWIRFAARIALESQPFEAWQARLQKETDAQTLRTAWMALAHQSDPATQSIVLQGLLSQLPNELDRQECLWWLRTLELSLIRQGKETLALPESTVRQDLLRAISAIDDAPHFPTQWLVGELLVALESPTASDHLAKLLADAGTQEEQVQHAKSLNRIKTKWSTEARSVMIQWLLDHRRLRGGRLVEKTLSELRDDFITNLTSEERSQFADLIAKLIAPVSEQPVSEQAIEQGGPTRPLVKKWELEELDSLIAAQKGSARDLDRGSRIASEASCLKCHVFGERGSHIGPDLSNVGKRFDQRALLESIVEPSKQVDAKFTISNYQLVDGRVVSGRAASVTGKQLAIETNAMTGESITIERADIEESRLSQLSPMPSGLLDTFTHEEIADLIAFLRRETQVSSVGSSK